jgi:hypothetical protein
MADRITYVGLDVHKESIVVAVAAGGLRGEVREYGRIANTATALDRLLRKLGGAGMALRFCFCLARMSPKQALAGKPRISLACIWHIGGHESGSALTNDSSWLVCMRVWLDEKRRRGPA